MAAKKVQLGCDEEGYGLKKRTTILFVLCGIIFLTGCMASGSDQRSALKKREEGLRQYREETHAKSFEFYGQVVDLEGNPVPDALVTVRVMRTPLLPFMSEVKEVKRTTDDNGRFALDESGYYFSLKNIEKEGYEYRFQYNSNRSFTYRPGKTKKAELGQLPEHPVQFKIRKRGIPTLVLGGGAGYQLKPGASRVFDLLRREWDYPKYVRATQTRFKDWHPDLKLMLEGEPGNYRLTLETQDSDTGIQRIDQELFEAPEQGYHPKVVFPLKAGEGVTTFLYVKGRGGKFYTRIKLSAGAREKWMNIDLLYSTNMRGERNLEGSAELARQWREEMYGGGAKKVSD